MDELTGEALRKECNKVIQSLNDYSRSLDNLKTTLIKLSRITQIDAFNKPAINTVDKWVKGIVEKIQICTQQDQLEAGEYFVDSLNKHYTLRELRFIEYRVIFIAARIHQLITHSQFGEGLISKMLAFEGKPKGQQLIFQRFQR